MLIFEFTQASEVNFGNVANSAWLWGTVQGLIITNCCDKTKHIEPCISNTAVITPSNPKRAGVSYGFKFSNTFSADLSLVFVAVWLCLSVSGCDLLLLPGRPTLLQLLRRLSDVGAGCAQAAARLLQQVQRAGDLRDGGVGDVPGSPCPGQGLLPRPLLHFGGQLAQSHKVARARCLVGQFTGGGFGHSSWKQQSRRSVVVMMLMRNPTARSQVAGVA